MFYKEIYSAHNKGKSFDAERFIRTLKSNIIKLDLGKLSDAMKNEVVKKTVYGELVKKGD